MKLFYKKDYEMVLVELEIAERRYKKDIGELQKELEASKYINNQYAKVIEQDSSINEKLRQDHKANKKLLKEKCKELADVTEKYNELQKEFEEFKKNKFIVREVKSGKTPNTLKTKVAPPMKSSVRRYMKEEFD